MESVEIKTFSEFVELIENAPTQDHLMLYRGQAVKRNLLPRIARSNPHIDTTDVEKKMLDELRRLGAAFLSGNHDDDWELLVSAQHYGLATRLLDWSSNPLAALWFACASESRSDGYLYCLDTSDLIIPPGKGPFNLGKTRVFRPRMNNARIVAQHGWFTAHCYSSGTEGFVRLEHNKVIKHQIVEVVIPELYKKSLLKSLDRHGTSYRTLFPDLEGLCKYVTWKECGDGA